MRSSPVASLFSLGLYCVKVGAFSPIGGVAHRSQAFRTHSSSSIPSNARSLTTPRRASESSSMVDLDDSNYRTFLGSKYEKAVLIDACAPWCGPCKLIEPILDQCQEKWETLVEVVKYNVESKQIIETKSELLMQGVMITGLPALVLVKEGKVLAKHAGVITEEQLDDFLSFNLRASVPTKTGAGFVHLGGLSEPDDYMLTSD